MVRETRYLLVRNLPEKVSEELISNHFQRYGKIQSVKLHTIKENDSTVSATVAFMDIKSASKAQNAENCLENAILRTEYCEGSATGSAVTRTHEPVQRLYSSVSRGPGAFPSWSNKGYCDVSFQRGCISWSTIATRCLQRCVHDVFANIMTSKDITLLEYVKKAGLDICTIDTVPADDHVWSISCPVDHGIPYLVVDSSPLLQQQS